MQTIGTRAGAAACPAYYAANRKLPPQRSGETEKNYGAKRCRNAFLGTRVKAIAPKCVTREWNGITYNYITRENYGFLRDSYMRYAGLLGVEAKHRPARTIGESILRLRTEIDTLIGSGLNVNLEYEEDRLFFVLWKYHQWRKCTLYWFPVKFLEYLNARLRRIAVTFLHQFMWSNSLDTMNDEEDTDYVLEWEEEAVVEERNKEDREEYLKMIDSYKHGKIYRLLKQVRTQSYYKNLPKELERYEAKNDFERKLIETMKEGLELICPERSIMQYAYDPFFDENPDFLPMQLERQIRFIYDIHDGITASLEEYFNSSMQETYEIIPTTVYRLTPQTEELFYMDDYPERFFTWADKFIELTA